MGRVFTPEQVEHRQVPEVASFEIAAKELLTESAKLPYFTGALVLGSVTTSSATSRSDLDTFIQISAGPNIRLSAAIEPYQELFEKIYSSSYVPVEANIFDLGQLTTGQHTIDPFFKRNLELVGKHSLNPADHNRQRWIAGDDPTITTELFDDDLPGAYRRYALAKLDTFKKAPRTFDAKTMQRALELPSALGRKTLALLENDVEVPAYDFITGPRKTVIRALGKANLSKACTELVHSQHKLDATYTSVLSKTLSTRMSLDHYTSWLDTHYRRSVSQAIDITEMLMEYALR